MRLFESPADFQNIFCKSQNLVVQGDSTNYRQGLLKKWFTKVAENGRKIVPKLSQNCQKIVQKCLKWGLQSGPELVETHCT